MFRTFIPAVVLSLGGMVLLAGPVRAQHHHHGGHHHHGHSHHQHHHGHFQYGHHNHSYPYSYGLSIGLGYGYPGYAYSYPRYYYADPVYRYSGYYSPDAVAYPARSAYVVNRQPASVPANRARLEVSLPDPDAEVWFEGNSTSSRGMTRAFESPELEAGQSYTYTVRASWTQGGRKLTEERQVKVTPGKTGIVDFTRSPEPERVPAPRRSELPP